MDQVSKLGLLKHHEKCETNKEFMSYSYKFGQMNFKIRANYALLGYFALGITLR